MKKIISMVLALTSILTLAACSERTASQTSEPPAQSVTGQEHKAFSPIEITSDNVLNSVRVFDTMYEDKDSAMFSPLSLNLCLGMLETGAAGSTKTALDNYLGTADSAAFAKEYLEHAKSFNTEVDNSYAKYKNVYEIANSFWASDSREFNADYITRVKDSFGAEIDTLDFTDPTKSAEIINDWADEKTHKMIPAIIRPDQLSADTAAVAVNTVYFESAWSDEWYLPEEQEDFTNADGTTTKTALMRNGGSAYFENDSAEAFSVYYKNGMQFIGILPKKTGDFTLESLDIPALLKSETHDYDVSARMPKLDFETEFPLTDALKAAGLSDVFSPLNSDFTPMQGSADEHFYLSEVIQKTKLELDEEGTRASAVTAAIMNDTAAAVIPEEREIKEVFLNRPFAFLIYDGEAEQTVFLGKVTRLQ